MALKKKFIKIQLPLIQDQITALGTPETLDKKTIKIDLSRKLRGRNLEATFSLKNVEDEIIGYPKKLELMKQYIIRMMRKRVNYVEDSFQAECSDTTCTIKPFLITRKKVSRAIRNSLRKTAKEEIKQYVKDRKYLEVTERVLYAEMQKELLPKLKKIYPLSVCEIRVLETKQLEKADLTWKQTDSERRLNDDSEEDQEETKTQESEEENEQEAEEITKETPKKTPKKKSSKKD